MQWQCNRAILRGRLGGQLPRAPTYKGLQDITGITGNVVPVNPGLHIHKIISEYYPQFGHTPLNRFTSPVLKAKNFKEYQTEETPNY